MATVSPQQSSAGDTIEAADINTPINQLAAQINGNLDADNLADSAVTPAKIAANAVTTAKIADDAVTDAKLVYGKVRSRQGGSSTNWSTVGTTAYDYSATDTFMQCGAILSNTSPKTVTFPVAFNQVPIVIATVATAGAANCFVRLGTVTSTTVQLQVITEAGASSTVENVNWIAVGQ